MPNEPNDKDKQLPTEDKEPKPAPAAKEEEDKDEKDPQKAINKLLSKQASLKDEIGQAKTREDALKAELAALKSEKDTAEKEKLKEQNKYKELWEGEESKTKTAKAKLIEGEIKRIAASEGLLDTDIAALIPRDSVTIGDDFNVVGAEAAVKAFKKSKPNLFKSEENPADKPATTETGARVGSPPPASGVTKAALEFKRGTKEYEERKRKFIKTGK